MNRLHACMHFTLIKATIGPTHHYLSLQNCRLIEAQQLYLESSNNTFKVCLCKQRKSLTWPELPKQFSTIAILLALASLFTVINKTFITISKLQI